MARDKQFHKVEIKRNDTIIAAAWVMVKSDRSAFFASIAEQYFSDPAPKPVIDWLEKQLKASVEMDWKPAIKIEITTPRGGEYGEIRTGVTLAFQRVYVAKPQHSEYVSVRWGIAHDQRLDNTRKIFTREIPYHKNDRDSWNDRGSSHIVWYTEELWVALNTISNLIGQLRERLTGLVGTEEAILQLQAAGVNVMQMMLPPGEVLANAQEILTSKE